MKPTIGRIVILHLTEEQQKALSGNHVDHTGKPSEHCRTAAAVVVQVWGSGSCVNLKVIGDSEKNLWVTSANEGTLPGNWQWPEIVR